jgi:hypothetical protein
MYTSKRVFNKNDINLNYRDYNKIKNGIEILKTIKTENNLAILKQFTNYNSLQTLSSAYYPFIDNNTVDVTYLKNIYNANESFTYNEEDLDDISMCKNTLYPYGKIISKKIINPQFSTNIYLCKWCNNKPKIQQNLYEVDESYSHDCNCKSDIKHCNYKNNIKHCNLCKNARALFI